MLTGITEPEGDVAGEMQCEMQARDFFIHVGMLIVEGRTPEYSDKGRIQGPHCMSWFSMDPHVCDQRKDYRVSWMTKEQSLCLIYSCSLQR